MVEREPFVDSSDIASVNALLIKLVSKGVSSCLLAAEQAHARISSSDTKYSSRESPTEKSPWEREEECPKSCVPPDSRLVLIKRELRRDLCGRGRRAISLERPFLPGHWHHASEETSGGEKKRVPRSKMHLALKYAQVEPLRN